MLVAEVGARWADARGLIPAASEWDAFRRLRSLDLDLDANPTPTVLFCGDSTMGALDVSTLRGELGASRPMVMASIPGADVGVLRDALVRLLLPRCHPKVLVQGLDTQAVNPHGLRARQAARVRSDVLELAESPIGFRWTVLAFEHSALFRHQFKLREGLLTPWRLRSVIGDRARRAEPSEPGAWTLDDTRYVYDAEHRHEFGAPALVALGAIADRCRDEGVVFVLADMPLPVEYGGYWPDGWETWRRYRDRLEGFCRERDVPLIDLHAGGFLHDEFRDSHHLTADGAERASRLLVKGLRDRALIP